MKAIGGHIGLPGAILVALVGFLVGAVPMGAATRDDPDRLLLGAGIYDVAHGDQEHLDLRLEYRWGRGWWILRPWVGVEVTTEEAIYGVAGVLADFDLNPHWVFTPGIGVGAYEDGDGEDLGHTVEFRSQSERLLLDPARPASVSAPSKWTRLHLTANVSVVHFDS